MWFLILLLVMIMFVAILCVWFYRKERNSMDVVKYIDYSYRDTDDK